jgi:hypothetical protein
MTIPRALSMGLVKRMVVGLGLVGAAVACRRSATDAAPIRRDEPPPPQPTCTEFERRALPPAGERSVRDLAWSIDALALLVDAGQDRRAVHLHRSDGTAIGAVPVTGDRLQSIPPRRLAVFGRSASVGRAAVIVDLERGCHETVSVRPDEAIVAVDPIRQAMIVQRPTELVFRALRGAPLIAAGPVAVTAFAVEARGDTIVLSSADVVQILDAATLAVRATHVHYAYVFASSPRGDRIAFAEVTRMPCRYRQGSRTCHGGGVRHSIHVVDGSDHELEIIREKAEHLAWSNDGRALAFTGAGLRVHRDGETRVLEGTPNHGALAWAPDDLLLAVVRAADVEIRRTDGTLVRTIR